MKRALRSADIVLTRVTLALAMSLLASMACVSMYQVVSRFVFERPSTWSEVTSRSLQVWMVYLGLVAAFRHGSLLSVDMLVHLLPRKAAVAVLVAIASVTAGTLLVMGWYGLEMADRVWNQSLAGLVNPLTGDGISIAIVYAAVPIGGFLSIIAVAARLLDDLTILSDKGSLRETNIDGAGEKV